MAESSSQSSHAYSRRNSRKVSLALEDSSQFGSESEASWRNYLITWLGESDADYFLNPKPKDKPVEIDQSLYDVHHLDNLWQVLRDRSGQRLQETLERRKDDKKRSGDLDESDLDKAYFAFGRYFLKQTGKMLPSRSFWKKESEFRSHLDKLADQHKNVKTARYNQECGVSFRAAVTNTDRSSNLIENATYNGGSVFNNERQTNAAIFSDDLPADSSDATPTSKREETVVSVETNRVNKKQPKLIFLTEEEAHKEAFDVEKAWSKRIQSKPPSLAASPTSDQVFKEYRQPSPVVADKSNLWEPLSLPAAADWSRGASK